jgi:hypothetical protein
MNFLLKIVEAKNLPALGKLINKIKIKTEKVIHFVKYHMEKMGTEPKPNQKHLIQCGMKPSVLNPLIMMKK